MAEAIARTSHNVDETKAFAASLASCAQPGDIFVLSGDLGAGKTQFSQGFAAGLGITEPVTSPTFNLVFEYPAGRIPLYHFDVYRLEDISELDDIGFYEMLDGDGICLVEWGEKFLEAFEDDFVHITIAHAEGDLRTLTVEPHGLRAAELVRAWLADAPAENE